MRLQPRRQERGDHPDRQVDEEDRAPAEIMREKSAGHRPERARHHHHARQIALIAPALARRNGLADQRLGERHQAAPAQPLDDPGERQHLDVLRQRAQHRRRHEDRKRHEHHALAAEHVAELTIDRRRHRVGDQIGDHHPGHAPDLADRRRDRRQRRRHDGLVDHRQEHRQHDRGKHAEEQAARRIRRRLLGGGWRAVDGHDRGGPVLVGVVDPPCGAGPRR